jgi:hypothetical protein
MITKRELVQIVIILLLVGVFWVFNNLLEFYFVPTTKATSFLIKTFFYCVFYYIIALFIKRKKYVLDDKPIIIKRLMVFFMPWIVISIALYMLVGLNTQTRITILLSGLIIAFFVLFKSLKKKQI